MVPDLSQRSRVVQSPVHHHHLHRLGVADVLQRVGGQHDQVRKLPFLYRAKIVVHPQILGPAQRGHPDRLEWRHTTLDEHPQLPVRAQPLDLAVRSQLNQATGILNGLRTAGNRHVVEILISGRFEPAARPAVHHGPRHEAEEPFVLPDIGAFVPVELPRESTVPHDQRRRVTRPAATEQFRQVLVHHGNG